MTALSVVLTRFLCFIPNDEIRISFESGIIFLSGLLFGPVWGGCVGLASDLIGSVFFSPFGYNPIFCPVPILYGVCGGLSRKFLKKKLTVLRLALCVAFPVVLGSVIWQSFALDLIYSVGFSVMLYLRAVQFAFVWFIDVIVIKLLFDCKVFEHLGVWGSDGKIAERKLKREYKKALRYIHSVSWKGSVPGLERTRELLSLMGNPQKSTKFIHIVGTNGKGSTAAMTASILTQAGYTAGLYTSPYIFSFNERMKVNGADISDEELVQIVAFIKPLADGMKDTPTEFELVTCIAFEFFKRHGCDVVCLEAGMGGELDSTNVIDSPLAAVITNIGLDHTEYLGDTLEKIALTKSKVIKEGCVAVLYDTCPSVEEVFANRCHKVGATLVKADFSAVRDVKSSLEGQTFSWKEYDGLFIRLIGSHQLKNASVVLTLIGQLNLRGFKITQAAVKKGLKEVAWPGRFEIVSHSPLFIVDGGHNPQCIEALVENVKTYLPDGKLVILTGVLADKDYEKMYSEMAEYASEFVTYTVPNPRALSAGSLGKYLERFSKPVTVCKSIKKGVNTAKKTAGKDGTVLACGSLYAVSEIEKYAREL